MKSHLSSFITLSLFALGGAVHGQSAYERDLEQLIEQRDKALAAAAAPIHERFQATAEQMLRRATQAGDLAAATKIQAAIAANVQASRAGIKDLRKELAGTTWKSLPGKPVRPGLGPTFSLTEKDVQPGGYKYDVEKSNTVIITFNQGGTQVMTLAKGGTRLEFSLGAVDYVYEIARK